MHLLLHPTEEKDDAALRDNDNLVCLNVGGKVSESDISKEVYIEVKCESAYFSADALYYFHFSVTGQCGRTLWIFQGQG